MIQRTYIEKFTTIRSGSTLNVGINPVSELCYGTSISRNLVYFDISDLQCKLSNKIYPSTDKLTHRLKITNAGSLDFTQMHCGETSSMTDDVKLRASSFDIIFFLIPQEWDGGKGFDYALSLYNQGYYGKKCNAVNVDSSKLVSYDGCTWFQSRTNIDWEEEGIYSNDTLSKEYNKFSSTEGSTIVIGRQRFDIGNESIDFDVTDIVNKMINGEIENHGIGFAYAPSYEMIEDDVEHYVGFLTHKTPSFFEPYLETTYHDFISDDRSNFVLDKDNKLYLYCNFGSQLDNLDELPTCKVNEKECVVEQFSKGIYYVNVNISSKEFEEGTMLYDVWSNIKYHGVEFDDVELDFVVKKNSVFFNIGNTIINDQKVTPTIYGIDNAEKIKRGDLRKLVIDSRVNYTKNTSALIDDIELRLYIHDGTREVDVISFDKVNKTFNENYYLIDTSMLIPQRYYIDVKYHYNMEEINHHNVLSFDITDNLNNKYN